MNREELKAQLRSDGLDPASFTFDSRLATEQSVLDEENGQWVIFYAERGNRNDVAYFDNGNPACEALYARLIRDDSTGNC